MTRLLKVLVLLSIALAVLCTLVRLTLDLKQLDADARQGHREVPTMPYADDGTPGPAHEMPAD
jgi:hypothetical protein